jgi:hypothetical protein
LSRDGQGVWQEIVGLSFLPVDIPETGLYSFDVPNAGVKYTNGGVRDYVRITSGAIGDLVTKAMAKSGR